MEWQWDQGALQLQRQIQQAGYACVIVGGAVRDVLRGQRPTDYDLATSADAATLAQLLLQAQPTGGPYGTVTLCHGDAAGLHSYEITPFRAEDGYSDGRHPDKVRFGVSLEEDLARRDFTVNAMAWDGQQLIDPFGGQADLAARRIVTVGDPVRRFREDGLRILRALRFASVLDFTLSPETLAAAISCRSCLRSVSLPRVKNELQAALLGKAPQALDAFVAVGGLRFLGLRTPGDLSQTHRTTPPEADADSAPDAVDTKSSQGAACEGGVENAGRAGNIPYIETKENTNSIISEGIAPESTAAKGDTVAAAATAEDAPNTEGVSGVAPESVSTQQVTVAAAVAAEDTAPQAVPAPAGFEPMPSAPDKATAFTAVSRVPIHFAALQQEAEKERATPAEVAPAPQADDLSAAAAPEATPATQPAGQNAPLGAPAATAAADLATDAGSAAATASDRAAKATAEGATVPAVENANAATAAQPAATAVAEPAANARLSAEAATQTAKQLSFADMPTQQPAQQPAVEAAFTLAPLAGVPCRMLLRWWAFLTLMQADKKYLCTQLGFSQTFYHDMVLLDTFFASTADRVTLKRRAAQPLPVSMEELLQAFCALDAAFADDLALWRQVEAANEPYTLEQLAINGRDLLALGLRGAAIGRRLALLREAVLAEPSLNRRPTLLALSQALDALG